MRRPAHHPAADRAWRHRRPAGAYTLFTLPNADGSAKLSFSKQLAVGLQYDEKQDFAASI